MEYARHIQEGLPVRHDSIIQPAVVATLAAALATLAGVRRRAMRSDPTPGVRHAGGAGRRSFPP